VNQQHAIPEGWQDDANSDHGGEKGKSAVSVTSRSSESVSAGEGGKALHIVYILCLLGPVWNQTAIRSRRVKVCVIKQLKRVYRALLLSNSQSFYQCRKSIVEP